MLFFMFDNIKAWIYIKRSHPIPRDKLMMQRRRGLIGEGKYLRRERSVHT